MGDLSDHFNWSEASASSTAAARGIDNTIPPTLFGNVERTARLMEDIRTLLGHTPIRVTSWYRSPELNRAIGGSKTSAHMKGLAVDFQTPRMDLKAAFERIADSGTLFDQLILERTRDGAYWIHVGLSYGAPRREVLTAKGGVLGGAMAFRRVRAG